MIYTSLLNMAIRRTTVEENVETADPKVVRTTQTVVNPDIHTQVVEDRNVEVNTPGASTVKQTRVVQEPVVKTEHPQKIYEKKKSIFRISELIWALLGVIEFLLGFRIALKALGADPTSGFASIIYSISQPLAVPFSGILQTYIGTGGSVFEWSTMIAAIVYALIAVGLVHLLGFARPITPEEVEQNV